MPIARGKNIFGILRIARICSCAFWKSWYHRFHDPQSRRASPRCRELPRVAANAGGDDRVARGKRCFARGNDRIAGPEAGRTHDRDGEDAEASRAISSTAIAARSGSSRPRTRPFCPSKAARSSRRPGRKRRPRPSDRADLHGDTHRHQEEAGRIAAGPSAAGRKGHRGR